MRSGNCGINLTQANKVFLMEPSFNPALEAQAIGRVHRLGQKRDVEIIRLVISDSFESRMVGFLEKKYGLNFGKVASQAKVANSTSANETEKDSSDEATDKNKKSVKVVDDVCKAAGNAIAGNLTADKAQLMTEEFDELFGVQDRVASDNNEENDANSLRPGTSAAIGGLSFHGMDLDSDSDDEVPDAIMSGLV
mmetsp:Transcript_22612/g.39703  ORF Transcript_22612/g.39703 Transcript_22612/m.39703 type:complete len:194 (-) Transcript_22612:193-774(-)